MGFPGRDSGTGRRDDSNMMDYNEAFIPTTVGEEFAADGWLRTTKPVGSGDLNPLITSGMRGHEEDLGPTASKKRRGRASLGGFDAEDLGGDD